MLSRITTWDRRLPSFSRVVEVDRHVVGKIDTLAVEARDADEASGREGHATRFESQWMRLVLDPVAYRIGRMAISTIRELLEREPFQAFRVRASSGKTYEVRNPGLVVVLKSEIFVAEPNSDRFGFVPFLHIAGVELVGNGRGRRSRRPRR